MKRSEDIRWDREEKITRERERDGGSRKDRGGRVCRHSALRPTPVPSAMTYFQLGFYLDQTGSWKKKKKIRFDFSFVDYLWHRWSSEMVSNAIPQGSMFFKATVRTYPLSHCHEFSRHLDKLLVWNIRGKNRGVEHWMLSFALLFSYC